MRAQELPGEHGGVGPDTNSGEETDRVRRREPGNSAADARRDIPQRKEIHLWPLAIYRVAGESMLPTYQPGDTLLGWRWFRPRVGQVVVTRAGASAAPGPLIKRLVRLADGRAWVEGDNPAASTDSRHFGPVSRRDLEARIILRLDRGR